MLFSIFYDLALLLLLFVSAPKILYQLIKHGKYRNTFTMRLGIGFPSIKKNGKKIIWIHAVSVGETKAIASLALQLKKEVKDSILIISSITETGHVEAKKSIPCADYYVYLPLDLSFIVTPLVKKVAPDLVIICETDYWYHFLKACKACNATIAVANGKISTRSHRRHSLMPFFANRLFSHIDLLCLQNNTYLQRFNAIGIDKKKLTITGNLKLDTSENSQQLPALEKWKQTLHISDENSVIVVGSTHHLEEQKILESIQHVRKQYPKVKILVVPRHPERFEQVWNYLRKQYTTGRLSQSELITGREEVILIDAMGKLNTCYQIADIAIVGGSFVNHVGGHNIVEPCYYGVPVLFGPFMHAQEDFVNIVQEHKAGLQVSIDELADSLLQILSDSTKHETMGKAGLKLMQNAKGSTAITLEKLLTLHNEKD